MSLATFHTDARRAAIRLKQAPARLAARLCGVDPALALHMHEWLTAPPRVAQEMPQSFSSGAAAACFALIKISVDKPAIFWGALFAFLSLPLWLALRWI
ncbi:hypothetical protein [Cupriavidus consociatus]|uniref:hypothetical protein n=1 Tax=Cupriavidus consociatus TaxID=2821357 RepID=UPI001AE7FCA2|nr:MULTISPECIES: hypothetical protein [unclassified Cupriavidus]MBP0623411.1 hypothetical protein [Cupriavidus sp. LEh25]MDK2660110.1 hypothetical protein [Cupriavidus sp. LEh21]